MKKSYVFNMGVGAALALFALMAVNPTRARAQCNCLLFSKSVSILCDSCWDSIVHHKGFDDTFIVCDTCYTWAITNNCDSAIGSLTISDLTTGGLNGQGCNQVQDPTHSTWNDTVNMDGSVTLTAGPGNCLQPGKTILVSFCSALKAGDLIKIDWTWCEGVPAQPPCPDFFGNVP
ncbi:MAG: hypothetical protein ACREBW_09725 [Candidatus Micrarchaeaceae archaeon]